MPAIVVLVVILSASSSSRLPTGAVAWLLLVAAVVRSVFDYIQSDDFYFGRPSQQDRAHT